MNPTRRLAPLSLIPAAALLLSGCSPAADGAAAEAGGIQVVASTNVYGSIAEAIGGDNIDLTNIIDSAAQDPHSYEASAQDQLAISKADVIVENGGGYDPFIDTLISAAGSDDVTVLTAVDLSGLLPEDEHAEDEHAEDEHAEDEHAHDHEAEGDDHGHVEGFNEHVWYDLATVDALAEELAHHFAELDPDNAATYDENYTAFADEIGTLTDTASAIKTDADGTGVAVTEPVPVYLLEASGLVNLTPDAFSEAIEEGTDVSPASLSELLDLIGSGDVSLLAYNEQTSSPETERVREAAEQESVPVVSFAETLPDGEDYVSWMTDNITAISDALDS
ncbi:zinc/manganese transport system substrate-binding protein [Mycetocola sp. CAN_C7]|uniref:metal ABC transporter solute-binding protein, Zn/Mn family n=1 Tax=Mycetocola sp. CAN_C7 TaxID=2787724 RepID=UPI0018CB4C70